MMEPSQLNAHKTRSHRKMSRRYSDMQQNTFFFFFFQAEDGIRDFHVTGVQTCALPISWGLGLPGFTGMKLDPTPGPGMGLDARPGPRSPFLHFPDGNATLARLLVQRLIPRAVPGQIGRASCRERV